MKETVQLELCGYCVAAIQAGAGDTRRVETLQRKFQGGLTAFVSDVITTFRACDGCGETHGNVRYSTTHTFEHDN